MVLRINGVTLDIGEKEDILPGRVAFLLGIEERGVSSVVVLRRSLDARRSRPPRWIYLLEIRLAEESNRRRKPEQVRAGITVDEIPEGAPITVVRPPAGTPAFRDKPVVIGSGPAGLFAALTLAKSGVPVVLLERGGPVEERVVDVERFWEKGILNAESNVCFGEGGAGTFSDGKLTSRAKNPLAAEVKKTLVDMGAPAEILIDAHPHIGTDRLRRVVENTRKHLISFGCDIRFHSHVTDFIVHRGRISGVVVNRSEEIMTNYLILATGQSASDTYGKLAELGVAMAPKAFAMGLRVEHPQELVNRIQYGRWAGHRDLPPAEYFLTANLKDMDRSVYSFCMCPGGSVIGCGEAGGGLVTNGMSFLKRDGDYANSAMVVNVRAEDIGGEGPLAGLAFRRHWEEAAFTAGGADYSAPVQRMPDFMTGKNLSPVGRCSYRPGIREAELSGVLPVFAVEALRRGFKEFEKKMPGFVTEEAVLIGVETRTSSPVRIIRGPDGQSINVKGIFPCGEGAGYAGGIISSAWDGIKAAESVINAVLNALP
jgi:uncharacterized FAD-dependent dehydrogenase